jgi:SAM-dependent methyltransferase
MSLYPVLRTVLNKIDYRLSRHAFSRPEYQVELILEKLKKIHTPLFKKLLDVGGGFDGRYRKALEKIAEKYQNLEIENGPNVDIVGSVYNLPILSNSQSLVTSFMVLEHLAEPLQGLKETNRVLKKGGFLALTTVQYWHTHAYPSDYYRYTRFGLEYLLKKSGFKIVKIWSHGGPFLVSFHSIELNLEGIPRTIFSILFYRFANFLDWVFFRHADKRKNFDSVGWSVIALKK